MLILILRVYGHPVFSTVNNKLRGLQAGEKIASMP